MLKIGIIGLGDIAQKAYLPVLSSKYLEIHLFARNQERLTQIGRQYRIINLHSSLESILESGIKGAFVHTATESHESIIEQLLRHNIHVYVDKPITYDFASSKRLIDLAESRGLNLMVGFNRRYAPAYRELKQVENPNMVILQKNRHSLPGDIRTFVFDDFIHVIDTMRYLFDRPVEEVLVRGMKRDGLLIHAVVQLISENGSTAIGIMNRDSGTLEEKVEVFSTEEKKTVVNMTNLSTMRQKTEISSGINDWESTLSKRGFESIVQDFLQALENGTKPQFSMQDALLTHEMCENVVNQLIIDS
ncbi:MAG: oxidoreductase [Sphingobacteriales bacterium 17-39-43]|uniref:Gfo/Idh/MocA family protein n=1 Tax=Daejeonella sp. TaxID=2805397 RepID=UPI000BD0C08A|nr:Gfo/Idh/MocA family oxidoreductase [Daejeonella sp.]OYZ28292.1 MAG: oxidoreductase [Sphingobacteriales bacterium 16-39-50]OZA24544.1 MAG: oxidoreductase [Sphingobacteriales bacterium 17-39-43]HQT24842.1 Gfo/Idh/MocA family oxidoreductase [Daejeonella sp.]HQT56638.1 Gfo/Idh/MocA family oxidoreductase [Daejeonella sp.]